MKPNWLDRTLCGSPLCLTLCTKPKQLRKVLKQFRIKKSDYPDFVLTWCADATTHVIENRGQRSTAAVVCIAHCEGKTRAQIDALLAHEATHVWQRACELLGESAPSAEFEAYAIQNITQALIEEYVRQKE